MAHQLDFKVTIWSNDQSALLALEQYLRNMETATSFDDIKAKLLSSYLSMYEDKMERVDVHSIDINWDEEEDPLEKEQNLPRLTREQLYQGDWGKFDEEEAKRIRKLLYDADEQSEWGQIMHDQVMVDLVDDEPQP